MPDREYLMYRPSCKNQMADNIIPDLHSQSYNEVIKDTAKFVCALQDKPDMQEVFISLLMRPKRDLKRLSNGLQALLKRLEFGSSEGMSEVISFPELFAHLLTPSPQTLVQVKALIIATEAFKELDPVSIDCILKLTSEERNNIFVLFKEIPIFSSVHGLGKSSLSESDPINYQLLTRIGFTSWKGKLVYEKQLGCCGLDMITLTIIAIHSVTSISVYQSH